MLNLSKKVDLQRLVDEGIEESLTLDYKASPSLSREGGKPDELCKDVSALANSAGGLLIYGIEEDKSAGKPSKVDDGVVDPKITKDWIEQILNSKVQPRMDGVRIERVDMETGKYGYVISVQQSQIGPHQAPDGKYYKRFNFQSVPMHDYEIRDIMRRSTTPHLYVKFSFLDKRDRAHFDYKANEEISKPVLLLGTLGNQSPQPAHYAMVRVGISSSIGIRQGPPWITPVVEETEDYGQLAWVSQVISVPPNLPVFKELEQPLDQRGIALFFHSRTLAQSHRWPVVVEILCPGFTSREAWFIQQQGSNLRLLPPGHPLLR
ncbi:AlbA family DNA-binding domain-containing protein [Bradyrhizobium sp. USDA 4473]